MVVTSTIVTHSYGAIMSAVSLSTLLAQWGHMCVFLKKTIQVTERARGTTHKGRGQKAKLER